jgi:hypothetical protein
MRFIFGALLIGAGLSPFTPGRFDDRRHICLFGLTSL